MRSIVTVMLFLCGCAPLMQESGTGAGQGSGSQEKREPNALERYLHRRALVADTTAVEQPYVAVVPFIDESGFRRDVWELDVELGRFVSAEMAAFPDWNVVPYDVVLTAMARGRRRRTEHALAAGAAVEADMVVLGTLVDYNMGRFTVGDPLLGGYKSYNGVARLLLETLSVRDGEEIATVEGASELVDRDLGLDLLGKPRDQDLQFTGLGEMEFGSEEFRATVLGQATVEAVAAALRKLAYAIHPQDLDLRGGTAEVLSVYGEDVYINLGSENGVRVGYRFAVRPSPERVRRQELEPRTRIAVLEVSEVIGARLSRVVVLQQDLTLQAGDRIELLDTEADGRSADPAAAD